MSRPIALSALRARVRYLGDFGPDQTTGRYPNARLNTEINASWARFREFAVLKGEAAYLKMATATMTPGAVANQSYGTITLPTDCLEIHGIDVVFSGQDIEGLEGASWADRNQFRDMYGGPTGRPVAFCALNMGVETTTTVSAPTAAIFPAPDLGYTYTVSYIPVWVDRVNDTDVFDGVAGHESWVIADVVIQICAGDNDSQRVVQIAMAERTKAETLLIDRMSSLQRVTPIRRRDVAGQSRRARQLYWRRPR